MWIWRQRCQGSLIDSRYNFYDFYGENGANLAYETFNFSSMSTTMVRIGDNFVQFIFIKFTVVLNSTSYVSRKLEKTRNMLPRYTKNNAGGLKLY